MGVIILLQNIRSLNLIKKKPVMFLLGFFCIASVFFFVKILCSGQVYQFNGEKVFTDGDSPSAVYTNIELKPGIYHVEMEMAADRDKIAVCTVEDGTVFTGGLLTNGEHMYAGMTRTDFDFWLFESTEHLQIVVEYGGEGTLTCGNLVIRDTGKLWSMLWVVLGFFVFIALLSIIFILYDKKYSISKSKKQVIFFIIVISLAASFPYLCGYNITGADLTYHLQRIEGVKDGLKGGYFPVRLEPEWLYGYGYANAIFYCNTFLYIPALLRLAGFTVSASYNIFCIMLNIATAWISWYCFGKIFRDDRIGIVCSGLYTLSVFRIYKLLITSAVGEGSAVTFLPLILYGFYRVFTEDIFNKRYKNAWIPLAAGYAGLIQTHVLTCEITILFTIMLLIAYIRKVFRKQTFLELVKAASAAFFVSLWYLVPFLDYYLTQDVHIKHVSARTIQDRGLYPAHLFFHFWRNGINTPTGENGMQYSHPVGIGLVLMLALCGFLVCWFSGIYEKEKGERLRFAKIISVIGMAFLWMSLNCFPWDKIQNLNGIFASLVSSLQFPNRFLGWGTTCLTLLLGFFLWFFRNRERYFYLIIIGVVVCIISSGFYLLNYANRNQNYFELYNEESMGFGYISGAEYLIEGTKEELLTFEKEPKVGQNVIVYDYTRGSLKADMYCENRGEKESYLDIPLLLYKGYHAYGEEKGLRIDYTENNGIRVYIPPQFSGNLKIRFESPFYWRISEIISIIAILLIIWQISKGYKRKDLI